MKRTLSVILAVLMLLTALPFAAVPAGAETYTEDFWYEILDDGTIEITYYNGSATDLTIPTEIDGKPVTSIGTDAFEDCTSFASITIPDSVTSIEMSAFYGCTGLASVTIGNSVTNIGDWAFCGCTNLTSVTIPDSVTSIGWDAFRGCTSLTSIMIPDSVTSIDSDAFENTAYYNDESNWEDDVLYIGNHLDSLLNLPICQPAVNCSHGSLFSSP